MNAVEIKALTNLMQVSKERLWMNDSYPRRPGTHFDYTEELAEQDIEIINQSINIVNDVLNRHRGVEVSDA